MGQGRSYPHWLANFPRMVFEFTLLEDELTASRTGHTLAEEGSRGSRELTAS